MFWKNTLRKKAKEANDILEELGLEAHTETGKQIRGAIAMELLGQKYDMMDKHSKATFVHQHGDVMLDVRQMLLDEGILTKRPGKTLENKSGK